MSRSALWRARRAWSTQALDVDAMRTAAGDLLGEHDFSAFRTAACQARNPVRTVHALEVVRRGGFIAIDIRANAFLHNMVRIIVGTLLAIGRGKQSPDWTGDLLASRDRTRGGDTAPPQGLYFLGPSYPERFSLPPRGETGVIVP
jgi:tRNA pseudouridine38-40 synthase